MYVCTREDSQKQYELQCTAAYKRKAPSWETRKYLFFLVRIDVGENQEAQFLLLDMNISPRM